MRLGVRPSNYLNVRAVILLECCSPGCSIPAQALVLKAPHITCNRIKIWSSCGSDYEDYITDRLLMTTRLQSDYRIIGDLYLVLSSSCIHWEQRVAVADAWGEFENPEEGECPLLPENQWRDSRPRRLSASCSELKNVWTGESTIEKCNCKVFPINITNITSCN
jgi:hypothetical protein